MSHWFRAGIVLLACITSLEVVAAGGLARRALAGPNVTGYTNGGVWGVIIAGANDYRQLGSGADPLVTSYASYFQVLGNGYVRSMAAGNTHVIMALDDGSVQFWGAQANYTMSSGSPTPTPTTLGIPFFRSAKQVAAGTSASYVLLESGELYAFGNNGVGQLGDTTTTPSSSPRRVAVGRKVVKVSANCDNAAAVDEVGRVWVWGSNASGQLAVGSAGGSNGTPSEVNIGGVVDVAVGCDFMLVQLADGQIFGWGANGLGQLGQNNTIPRYAPVAVPVQNASSIAAGWYHAMAVMVDGTVRAWGYNAYGQLGLGTTGGSQLAPQTVLGVNTAMSASLGAWHSVLVLQNRQDDMELWTTGYNGQGQLGFGSTLGVDRNTFAQSSGAIGNAPSLRRTGVRFAGSPDLFWTNTTSGQHGYWEGNTNVFRSMRPTLPGWRAFGTGDINFDDVTEIFFYNDFTGELYFWSPHGALTINNVAQIVDEGHVGVEAPGNQWRPQFVGDMDGDGAADIVWRNVGNGGVAIWFLDPQGRIVGNHAYGAVGLDWVIVGVGDFNGDGIDDILWRNSNSGGMFVWFRHRVRISHQAVSIGSAATSWVPQAVGDLDGDGRSDIFWRNTSTGQTFIWYMMGAGYAGAGGPTVADLNWNVVTTMMYDGDDPQSVVVWRNGVSGEVFFWRLGNRPTGPTFNFLTSQSGGAVDLSWQIVR